MPTPPPTPPSTPDEAAEQIAQALARLRGRRGPRPPWATGDPGSAPDGASPGPGLGGRRGHGMHHGGFHGGPHGGRSGAPGEGWVPGGGWGPGAARFAGPARLRLLEALAAASAPLSVTEIAEAVGVDQPRASRLVQQSVEMGLVERQADPDDARRTRIVLTERGRSVVRGFRGDRRDAVATALEGFTDAERGELARLLAKLAAAWPER
ncbi:MarR family winged helix-turn-helix transcriptional regulator [Microbacterium sp. W1N]|uniref:MarR family winged helix-turn-helix transcriptional regulator n=1 Tax=Microbacterium festucae TaxID=2977531 RepID=UPI0021BF9F78|nr:MarR family winged helix-turn-helix transcriptional regulator [Microbacterium festucae]MCT9819594.1 MarR family winged helix-turn-helix transcriptional regulator [Microbacterium festucae]